MGEKLVVGPINKGTRTDRTAFNIDNDSFPLLKNSYQWRGRVKRKRGTSFLNRLTRLFNSALSSYGSIVSINLSGGAANLISGFGLESTSSIAPGTVTIFDTTASVQYNDPAMDGTLVGMPSGSGTINYATGDITIAGGGSNTIRIIINYFPNLPVMGLKQLILNADQFPGSIAFDTKYAYSVSTASPYPVTAVNFYKNPSVSPDLPGYTAKTAVTPFVWNGEDYQQFWTVNYQGAFWATNGISIPFDPTKISMQFKPIVTLTVVAGGPPALVNLEITGHGLEVGDFVFINEVVSTTGVNFQTGYVITVIDADHVIVELPDATVATNGTGGIAQYLTNNSDPLKDCIRWYDGNPALTSGQQGWVNFMPPLSESNFSIADLPPSIYYLVGARMIVPFKDRLLFLGPVVQNSTGSPIYLQDTVIYSQNGTPYYTCSYTNTPSATVDTPTSSTNVFTPILLPDNQTATSPAFFEDSTGFGGFISAGFAQPIITVNANEDVLIVGFSNRQTRLVYSGNDVVPFNFFIINSELGSASTFSTATFDRGVICVGTNGMTITSQIGAQRADLDIPDQIFEFGITNNGPERVTAQRDFVSEWMYFSFASNQDNYKFPDRTLFYNYRDESWSIFYETYTAYGIIRKTASSEAWFQLDYFTWEQWNTPWNYSYSTLFQPQVVAGNQQGFILVRDNAITDESKSLYIKNISFPSIITGVTQASQAVITSNNNLISGQSITITEVVGMVELNGNTYTVVSATPTTITIGVNSTGFGAYISGGIATPPMIYSPNFCLSSDDFIVIEGAIGTIAPLVNNKIFTVQLIQNSGLPNANEFNLGGPNIKDLNGTYLGLGTIKRMYIPEIMTKQFPVGWELARKTRIGPQQYLLTKTDNAQITLNIFLSTDSSTSYTDAPQAIVPNESDNNTLVFSNILYTCPESTNLGLTPANTNLQMPTASRQSQIWHRINTSLLGDTVQLGFTLSRDQMLDPDFNNQFAEIELHGFILDVSPSQLLA